MTVLVQIVQVVRWQIFWWLMLTFADVIVGGLPQFVVAHESAGVRFVHTGQQGISSRSNAYNCRHAYTRPRQPGFAASTSKSNMLASMLSAYSKKHRVSTTDKTWRQISKPEQLNGTPDVSLQHCKVSCLKTHSCHSKTLKHAARPEIRLTLQAAHTAHCCLTNLGLICLGVNFCGPQVRDSFTLIGLHSKF